MERLLFEGERCRFGAVPSADLSVDVGDVTLDSALAEHQFFRDFSVSHSVRQQGENLIFASVAVASVGPVCTRGLERVGIHVDLEPEHPHMGSMILALAEYLENQQT